MRWNEESRAAFWVSPVRCSRGQPGCRHHLHAPRDRSIRTSAAAWLDVRWCMPARMAVYKIWAVPHLAWEETRGRRRGARRSGPAGGMDGCIMHHVTAGPWRSVNALRADGPWPWDKPAYGSLPYLPTSGTSMPVAGGLRGPTPGAGGTAGPPPPPALASVPSSEGMGIDTCSPKPPGVGVLPADQPGKPVEQSAATGHSWPAPRRSPLIDVTG